MVEERELLLASIVRVEMRPVLDAVHLEPFLLRRRAHEALEIAARMQRLAAPIGGGEQRRLDLRPDRRARAVVVVVKWMGANGVAERAAVRASSASDRASGPQTSSPCTRERLPRSPAPYAPSSPACRTSFPRTCRRCRRDGSCRGTSRPHPHRCTWRRGVAARARPRATG